MKKLKEAEKDNEKEKINIYKDKEKELHTSVADAGKGLCRKILRYKGNNFYIKQWERRYSRGFT